MASLVKKVALITGSTSGIGRGIADHFAELGARIIVCGRNVERGNQVVQSIRDRGGQADFFPVELSATSQCRNLIKFAAERFGQLDVLVNNAADVSRGTIEDTPGDLFDRQLAVNLRAPFVLIQTAIPHFRQRGGGSVINIGSVNAYVGETNLSAYAISKGGLMTLTRNAASFLDQYGIRVNQLNVGWTLTEGEKRIMQKEGRGSQWIDEALKMRRFGRLLEPADIAYAAAYFASDESRCITGTVMDFEQFPVGTPYRW
jgi:NAD(P)-dependent dehydrogenase (short-subunit alcohol dehydrogenase family)